MSDPRAECWRMAQDYLKEADELTEKISKTTNFGKMKASEIPAPIALYMQRAQIFATLASCEHSVILAGALELQIKETRDERVRKAFEEAREKRILKPDTELSDDEQDALRKGGLGHLLEGGAMP